MKKFKLAIFDLDGTIIDSRKDILSSTNFALSSMNFPTFKLEEILPHIGWGVLYLIKACIPSKYQNNSVILTKTLKLFEDHHLEECIKEVQCYEGVRDFLSSTPHIHKVLLTNKKEIYTHKTLSHLKIHSYFSKIIGGDTLTTKKPNPDALQVILENLNYSKDEIIMIGDGLPDIEFAKNTGISSLAILNGGISNPVILLKAKPTYNCPSFLQVSSFFIS